MLALNLTLTLKKETKERNLEKGKEKKTFRIQTPKM